MLSIRTRTQFFFFFEFRELDAEHVNTLFRSEGEQTFFLDRCLRASPRNSACSPQQKEKKKEKVVVLLQRDVFYPTPIFYANIFSILPVVNHTKTAHSFMTISIMYKRMLVTVYRISGIPPEGD